MRKTCRACCSIPPALTLQGPRTNLNLLAKRRCPMCRPLQLSILQGARPTFDQKTLRREQMRSSSLAKLPGHVFSSRAGYPLGLVQACIKAGNRQAFECLCRNVFQQNAHSRGCTPLLCWTSQNQRIHFFKAQPKRSLERGSFQCNGGLLVWELPSSENTSRASVPL